MFNDVQRLKVHRLHVILPITSLGLLLLLPFGKHKDPTCDVSGWLGENFTLVAQSIAQIDCSFADSAKVNSCCTLIQSFDVID